MDKRQARREFKERKTPMGVFAVRCTASGEGWVGSSRNLNAAKNSVWFQLRNGLHLNKQMQAAWNAHGEAAFEYQVLETLEEDLAQMLVHDALRSRQKHWEGKFAGSATSALPTAT